MAGRRVVDADADGAAHVAGHQTSPPPVPFFHTINYYLAISSATWAKCQSYRPCRV